MDEEARRLVREAYERTTDLIRTNRDKLEAVAQRLLKDEIINREVVRELIGPRPHESAEESEELDKAISFYHHAEEDSAPQTVQADESEQTKTSEDHDEVDKMLHDVKSWIGKTGGKVVENDEWLSKLAGRKGKADESVAEDGTEREAPEQGEQQQETDGNKTKKSNKKKSQRKHKPDKGSS